LKDELERILNEAVVAYSRRCPGICLERLRKSKKTVRIGGDRA
jgi:hypothetical protein